MPIVPHIACTEPEPDTIICRFMDLPKFRDLFANEELYFRRTDLFKEIDPEEALPPDDYVRASHGLMKYHLPDELTLNENQAFSRQVSEAHYIKHFDKERELRIVLTCYDPVGGANRHIDLNGFPHREPLDENPLHEWVHECKRRRIDLKTLVTEIRTSPWATTSELDEVNDWMKGKNFSWPVKPSDLTGQFTPSLEEYRNFGTS